MDDLPLYTLSAVDFNHYYGQYCTETSPPLAAFPGWRCVLGGVHNTTVDLHLLYESIVGRGGVSEADPDDVWWEVSRDSTLGANGAAGATLPLDALLAPALMRQVYQARIKGFIQYMADLVRRFEEQGQVQQAQPQQGQVQQGQPQQAQPQQAQAAVGGQQQAQQAEQQQQAAEQRRHAAEQVAALQRQEAARHRLEQEALRRRQKQQAALAAAQSARHHAQQQAQRTAEVVDRRQQPQQQNEAVNHKRGRSATAAAPVGTPEPAAADGGEPPAKRTRGQQQAAAGGSTPPPANARYPRRTPPQQQQQPPQPQQQRLPPAVDTPDPVPGDQLRSMAAWLRGATLSLLDGPQIVTATAALARRYRPGLARLLAVTTAALPPELYPVFGAKPPPRLARAPRVQAATAAAPVVRSSGERSSSPEDEMGIIRIGDHAQTPLPTYLGPAPPPASARLSAIESRYLTETRPLHMPGEDDRAASGAAARAGARRAAKTDAAARSGGAAAAPEGPEERLGRSLARGRVGLQPSYTEFARAMARLGSEQQRQDLLRGALLQLDEEMGPDLVERLGLTKLGCKLRVDWNGVDEALFAMGMLWKLRPKKAVQKEYLSHKSLHELQSYYYNVWKLRGTQLADYYYELEPYVRKTATDRRTELADAQRRAEIYDARVERVLAAERTKAELKLSERGSDSGSGGDGSGGGSGEGGGDGSGSGSGSGSGGGAAEQPPPRRERGGGSKGREARPRSRGSTPQPRRGGSERAGGGPTAAGAATAAGGGIAPRRTAPVSTRAAEPPAAVAPKTAAANGDPAPSEPKKQVQAPPAVAAAKATSEEPLPRGSDSSAATQPPASLSAPGGGGGGGGGTVIQIPSSMLVPGPDGRSSLATGAGPGAAGSVAVVTSPRQQQPDKQAGAPGGSVADAQQAAAGEEAPPRRAERDPRKRPPSWWQQGGGAAAASPPPVDAAAASPITSEPSGLDNAAGVKGAELPGRGTEEQQAQQAAAAPKQQQQLVPLMRRGRGGVRVTWGRRRPQERHLGPSGTPAVVGGSTGGTAPAPLQAGPSSPPAVGRPQPGSVLLVASPGAPGTSPKVIAVLASRSPTAVALQQQALQQQKQQQQVREAQQQQVAEPPKRRHGPAADRDRLRRVRAWLVAAARDPTSYAATAATSRRATCGRRACEARLAACPAEWRALLQGEWDAAVAAVTAATAAAAAQRAVAAGAGSDVRRPSAVASGKLQAS